jgi:alpha-tubulin suppressor-like RCC1 family protein
LKIAATLVGVSLLLTLILTSCMPPFGGFWQVPPPVKAFSAGDRHTAAVGTDGTLWTWGRNQGQLGDGTTTSRDRPVRIGFATNWASVSAGVSHTVAIRDDGTLWAWGLNWVGQLGDGTTIQRNSPVQIGSDNNWHFVSAGDSHTLAIKRDGTLWAWGNNHNGRLGDGTRQNRHRPVQIGLGITNWDSVSAGPSHTMAIRTDGTLWGWGNNQHGQLGDNTTWERLSPVRIEMTVTNWASVSAGPSHTMAIRTDGTLWGWGNNQHGQLGDNTTFDRRIPVRIGLAVTNWASVSAGERHTVAVRADGTLWAWGPNDRGQLGNGMPSSVIPQTAPLLVAPGMTANWRSVSAGSDYSTATRADGSLWAWGFNQHGQLGDGTTTQRNHPIQITR